MVNRHTDFLYARPSFLEGVARLMDFGNALNDYNRSDRPQEADERALRADWYAVGDDLRAAMVIEMKSPVGRTREDRSG
jgi:hypothetical protein